MIFKAVIFDYGQVLNAPLHASQAAERRARLAKRLRLAPQALWPYLFEGKPARLWMTGRLSWSDFWTAVLQPRGIHDPEEIESFAQAIFQETERLHPEMVELLYQLRDRFRLAVLSNATWTESEMARKFYDDYGLPEGLFDTIVTSRTYGTTKPDPTIFLEVLQRMDVRPIEAIFTDDHAHYTAAAAKLGLVIHTFTTPAHFRVFLAEKGVLLGPLSD